MSHVIRFRVPAEHQTETIKGDETLRGSVYHESEREFTGLVTRSHPDGSADLVIFPPNRPPVYVEGARAGDGDGSFTVDAAAAS